MAVNRIPEAGVHLLSRFCVALAVSTLSIFPARCSISLDDIIIDLLFRAGDCQGSVHTSEAGNGMGIGSSRGFRIKSPRRETRELS